MRRLNAALTAALVLLAACGVRSHDPDRMIPGDADFPAAARSSTLAGPADSSYLILSISMANSGLHFQRVDSTYSAAYRVRASIVQDTSVRVLDRTERVRALDVTETIRTDETIRFHDVIAVLPGRTILRLEVGDSAGPPGFTVVDTIDVPSFANHDVVLARPLLVHEANTRARTTERPAITVNARNTIAYGSGDPRYYLEMYGAPEAKVVSVRVVDEGDVPVWGGHVVMTNGSENLRSALIEIPADSLPIGNLQVELSHDGGPMQREPLTIAISEQMMILEFDDVLRLLRHVASASELDSLRRATGVRRNLVWERFWERRDTTPSTQANEFRDEFFQRIRMANAEFSEPGRPGWDTPRGTLLIVLGPPDFETERVLGRLTGAQSHLFEWVYESLPGGRTVLQFYDRSGFGRYELTPASEAVFNTVAARMRPSS